MRVLVCGGRDFSDSKFLNEVLDELNDGRPIEVLIHGNAKGADYLAGVWARMNWVKEISCPADWNAHGKSAGPIRNRFMLERHKPELVVAFSGGLGTAHMIGIAEKAGVNVVRPIKNSGEDGE